jgi:hypothetical protein
MLAIAESGVSKEGALPLSRLRQAGFHPADMQWTVNAVVGSPWLKTAFTLSAEASRSHVCRSCVHTVTTFPSPQSQEAIVVPCGERNVPSHTICEKRRPDSPMAVWLALATVLAV